MYVASQEGHTEVVDVLVRAGADVNQATTDQVTIHNTELLLHFVLCNELS